jgi:hypothetical protein
VTTIADEPRTSRSSESNIRRGRAGRHRHGGRSPARSQVPAVRIGRRRTGRSRPGMPPGVWEETRTRGRVVVRPARGPASPQTAYRGSDPLPCLFRGRVAPGEQSPGATRPRSTPAITKPKNWKLGFTRTAPGPKCRPATLTRNRGRASAGNFPSISFDASCFSLAVCGICCLGLSEQGREHATVPEILATWRYLSPAVRGVNCARVRSSNAAWKPVAPRCRSELKSRQKIDGQLRPGIETPRM